LASKKSTASRVHSASQIRRQAVVSAVPSGRPASLSQTGRKLSRAITTALLAVELSVPQIRSLANISSPPTSASPFECWWSARRTHRGCSELRCGRRRTSQVQCPLPSDPVRQTCLWLWSLVAQATRPLDASLHSANDDHPRHTGGSQSWLQPLTSNRGKDRRHNNGHGTPSTVVPGSQRT
jgi:hypothetical protein